LFAQASHIVDQSDQIILVDDYPLFFEADFETGGIEGFICLHVVENSVTVFEPDCFVVSVFVFVAGRAHSGGKVVEQRCQLFVLHEARGMYIPYFFHRKLWVMTWPPFRFFGVSMIQSGTLIVPAMSRNLGVETFVRDVFPSTSEPFRL
jgi:hypothetical protein